MQPPKAYRRLMITRIESLGFLDDEGISHKERGMAHAYMEDGKDGEIEYLDSLRSSSEHQYKQYLKDVAAKRELALKDQQLSDSRTPHK